MFPLSDLERSNLSQNSDVRTCLVSQISRRMCRKLETRPTYLAILRHDQGFVQPS